jgi:hypothetical protein
MVGTILPPLPHPPEDHSLATRLEVSHVDQKHDGQCKNHGAPNGVAPGAKINSFGFPMPTEQTIARDNYLEPDRMPPSHRSYHHNAASHKNPSKRNYYHNKSPKNVNARYHEDYPTNKITCNCNQPNKDSAKNRHQNKHPDKQTIHPKQVLLQQLCQMHHQQPSHQQNHLQMQPTEQFLNQKQTQKQNLQQQAIHPEEVILQELCQMHHQQPSHQHYNLQMQPTHQ